LIRTIVVAVVADSKTREGTEPPRPPAAGSRRGEIRPIPAATAVARILRPPRGAEKEKGNGRSRTGGTPPMPEGSGNIPITVQRTVTVVVVVTMVAVV